MSSETMWSNNPSSHSDTGSTSQYRSVLDQVDLSVAKLLNERRLSLNDGSVDDQLSFPFKKGLLSAITAPVGLYFQPGVISASQPNAPTPGITFGTALISAGIPSRHPPGANPGLDSFFRKFASVADATKDIEANLGKINLSSTALSNNRRPSVQDSHFNSPPGSLNENLNSRGGLRHQSILEKIDNYNNNSPIQATAVLYDLPAKDLLLLLIAASESMLLLQPPPHVGPGGHSFWNPAQAALFVPYGWQPFAYDMQPFPGAATATQPPMVQPPPFPFPAAWQQMPPPGGRPETAKTSSSDDGYLKVDSNSDSNSKKEGTSGPSGSGSGSGSGSSSKTKKTSEKSNSDSSESVSAGPGSSFQPGIGFQRFPYSPFNPYAVYQPESAPIPTSPPVTPDVANISGHQSPPPVAPKKKSKKPAHIYRLPLLEEVRANAKQYKLSDIYGHAVEFTKDQHGSRFIQQQIPVATAEAKEVVFNEFRDILFELMTDVFGNYVIQKYFEHGLPTQRKVLLLYMFGHIHELLLQMYGCRVVQRALESVDLDDQIRIVNELRDFVLECAKDQNSNHVIQKLIEKVPIEEIDFILKLLENQIYHLATHPYGCRVIQRLLEYLTPLDQEKILAELNRFLFYLIQDQYGNYVIQHILERGKQPDRQAILKVVLGLVVQFLKHKFALNVIEKCIKHGTRDQRRSILKEVMAGNEDVEIESVADDLALALMMKDQYANYVIQKLVEVFEANSEEKKLLVTKLRQYLKQILLKNLYGKHLALVEKMIQVAESALSE